MAVMLKIRMSEAMKVKHVDACGRAQSGSVRTNLVFAMPLHRRQETVAHDHVD